MPDDSDAGEKINASGGKGAAKNEARASGAQGTSLSAQPPLGASRRANPKGDGEGSTNQTGADSHAARQVALNRWLVGATFVIAGATVIYMILSFLQWREIRSGGEDTHRLAEAAQRQANAASQQVNAMQGQLGAVRDQANSMKAQTNTLDQSLAETRKSVNAAEKQANASMSQAKTSEASAKAAERSADIAAQAFNIGERPYITLTQQVTLVDFAPDKTPHVDILIANSGRTPALNVHARSYGTFRPERRLGKVEYANTPTLSEVVIQAASAPYKQTIPMFNDQATQPIINTVIDAIKQKQLWFFVYGIVEYQDGVGRPHLLKFCNVYNPTKSEMEFCEEHNTSQ